MPLHYTFDHCALIVRAVTVENGALAVGPVIPELPRVRILVLCLERALAMPDIEVPLALVPEFAAAVVSLGVLNLPVAVLFALAELPPVKGAVCIEALTRACDLSVGEIALVTTTVFHQEDTVAF